MVRVKFSIKMIQNFYQIFLVMYKYYLYVIFSRSLISTQEIMFMETKKLNNRLNLKINFRNRIYTNLKIIVKIRNCKICVRNIWNIIIKRFISKDCKIGLLVQATLKFLKKKTIWMATFDFITLFKLLISQNFLNSFKSIFYVRHATEQEMKKRYLLDIQDYCSMILGC